MTETLEAVEHNPAKLLELAIQQDLDVDKLERLMELQERWDIKQAKQSYYASLARFQETIPEIHKSKLVAFQTEKGQVSYSYAPLAEIVEQVKVQLRECGLTYRWEFDDGGESLAVTCIVTHVDGHSERATMVSPVDTSGKKNPVQQRGSTVTYLQRYTLIGALGLTTADADTDGRGRGNGGSGEKKSSEPGRDDPITFGKNKGIPWREVDAIYLANLVSKTSNANYRRWAQAELNARERDASKEESGLQEIKTDLSDDDVRAICIERYGQEDIGKLEPANRKDLTDYLKAEQRTRELDSQVDPEASNKMCQALFALPYYQLDAGQMAGYRQHLDIYLRILASKDHLSESAYAIVVGEWRNKTGIEIDEANTDQLVFLLNGLRKAYPGGG